MALWDGIENVGYGLHDDSTAVWIDLAGGRHLTLPKSGASRIVQWLDDGLYDVGANAFNWADFTWSDLIGPDNDKITISYVIVVHSYQPDFKRYVPFGMTGGDFGLNYGGQPNRFYCYFPWAHGGTIFLLDPFVEVGHSLTVMADGLNGYCYASADGLPMQSRKCGDYSARLGTFPQLFLHTGYNPTLDNSWACTLKTIRVYRRVLSETEIAHNWNVDRERFGIGQ